MNPHRGGRAARRCRSLLGDPERGSGTVLALTLVALVLILTTAVVGLGRAVHARGVAQTAADLGALAGAQVLHRPGGPSAGSEVCGTAGDVVVANGATLSGCEVAGGVVEVSAERRADLGLIARASARAGPA